MHNWGSSKENTTLLKFLETFALLLVSQLGPDLQLSPFSMAGPTSYSPLPPTLITLVGWSSVQHSAVLSLAMTGLISTHLGLTYNRNICERQPASQRRLL